ncbi:MAG: hypothetical protein IID37_02820 [Planctomycetes bacterium]|nr:hypothetical protein [Planctomycetota bacterium]
MIPTVVSPLSPILPRRHFGVRAILSLATGLGAALASIALAMEFGFHEPIVRLTILHLVQLAAVGLYAVRQVHQLATSHERLQQIRRSAVDWLLVVVGVVLLSVAYESTHPPLLAAAAFYIVAAQLLAAIRYGVGTAGNRLVHSQRRLKPGRLMVLSFGGGILLGALLLALPRATTPDYWAAHSDKVGQHLLGALFTSTSATCVTGLVVHDTGGDYTRFGQAVILALIQLGGLGIMVFGSIFGLLMRRQLSLRESLALQDSATPLVVGELRRVVLFMAVVTVVCESLGAAVLYGMWSTEIATTSDRLFYSVFHSVSAFCNAGFALDSASLQPWRGMWQVYTGIMPLIVIGGLGFPVLYELYGWGRHRLTLAAARWGKPRDMRHPTPRYPFSLHTKLVGVATTALIIVPAVLLFLFESPGARSAPVNTVDLQSGYVVHDLVLTDLRVVDRAAAALFQSVTCRTAGFNTVPLDTDSVSPATHFLMSLLMFVGGAPASTAGGVKITAVAVLLLGVYSTLRGRRHVESCGRLIPDLLVRRAGVLIMVMGTVVSAVTLALLLTERDASLQEVWFEAVSACATVGLSTGLTSELTIPGRVIIISAMFAGRLGPLSLLIALAGNPSARRYQYPQEQVIIG